MMSDLLLNNRYQLESELGRGGMGTVFRAYDSLLDRKVAIKVIDSTSENCLDADHCARLMREAKSAAQLNHPNIVSMYDAGESDGVFYIVMELVEGKSLHDYEFISIEQALNIARQICLALEHAHQHQIVHRDLKPENILITSEAVAKLTDFGLARSVASRLTAEGLIVGTVFYMAPELALGQDYDQRVDLYSLGVVIYELTTGRLPFIAEDPLAVISQHLHAPLVPPRTFRPDIAPALEEIILKLLAKDPGKRYHTAREVGDDLANVEPSMRTPPVSSLSQEIPDTLALLEQLARGRLVGRHKEIRQLHDLWNHTHQGHTHLALISGEPGVGKTRLAHEMMVYARLSGAVILQGGCYEYEATTPYVPLVEALRTWVQNQSADGLREKLGSMATELAKLAPEIEVKLGAMTPNPPLPPDEERLRMFDNVARFLQRLAREQGLLFFIDDLHWADQATLTLLHYLLRHMREDRLFVLAAYREVELDRSHPLANALVAWNRERLALRISLGRLSFEDTADMLKALFEINQVSDEFVQAVYRETEGNPFFIEEVIKALIEQGQIYRVDGSWERIEITELTIPQSVKEAIGRRLNRLGDDHLSVLYTAAVLGKSFVFSELNAVSDQAEDQILNALDEASAAQLVMAESGENFVFTHDNIREVLYEELNPIRRRRIHQRAGEKLEELYVHNLDAHLQDLAHHFIESADLAKGLKYSIQAAEKAERVYAHAEALLYYDRAAECAQTLDSSTDLAKIYEAIGNIYYLRGPFHKAVEAFQAALELTDDSAKRAELKTRIGVTYTYIGNEQAIEYLHTALKELDPQTQKLELARATAMIGRFHHYHGGSAEAIDYLEQARQIAEPIDDPGTLTEIYGYLAGAYQQAQPPQIEPSNQWARMSIALGERKNYPHAAALGYEFLAENAFIEGKWRQSLEYAARDQQIAEKIGSQGRLAWAETTRIYAYHGLGDLNKAIEAANNAQALAEKIGDTRLTVNIRAKRASVEVDLDDDEAADANIAYALERAEEYGQLQQYLWCYLSLGYIHIQRQEWESLLKLADRWNTLNIGKSYGWYLLAYLNLQDHQRLKEILLEIPDQLIDKLPLLAQAEAIDLVARIHAAQDDTQQAFALLEKAIEISQEAESRLLLARVHYHRSLLYKQRGNNEKACLDIQRAIELFKLCNAKRDLTKAYQILSEFECSI